MSNRWTFKIKPIKQLLDKYVKDNGWNWIDPFAGASELAEYRNDINKDMFQPNCENAFVYCESIILEKSGFNGILFDPPYSLRQIKECYTKCGVDFLYKDSLFFIFLSFFSLPFSSSTNSSNLFITFS